MILLDTAARPVVAHRGGRAHAPENTLLAFERALAAGADAIELDVHVTADGHLVVFHDPTVERTTNGTGAVARMALAAIRELDAGLGQRVPLLSEALEALPSTPLIIDVKDERAGHAIIDVLTRVGARDRVLLGSFLHAALVPARAAGVRTVASQPELQRMLAPAFFRRAVARVAFDAIAMPPAYYGIPLPVGGFVTSARVPVHVWTVNDPGAARRLWQRGVCGIITDDPATMVAERERVSVATASSR